MASSGARNAALETAHWIAWIAIIVAMAVCLVYFNDWRERDSRWFEVRPNDAVEEQVMTFDRIVRVPADERGHFVFEAEIDGQPVVLMADTGATVVALSHEDADRIGLAPHMLEYSGRSRTANGVARVAPVTLDRLRIGDIELRNVEAVVAEEGDLGVNLLGMSFLGRLSRFEIENGELVLTE